jgi:hypothetical protein
MTLSRDISRAETRLNRMESEYNNVRTELLADGSLSPDDNTILEELNDSINAAIERLNTLVERENAAYMSANAVEMDDMEVIGNLTPFSSEDFIEPFEASIGRWSALASSSVGDVRDYMETDAESASLSASDVLGVLTYVFPQSRVLAETAAAVSALLPIITACVNTAFAGSSGVRAINHIQDDWVNAFNAFGQGTHREAYDRFAIYWKINNDIAAEATGVPEAQVNDFKRACRTFGNEAPAGAMPTIQNIKRAFVNKLLERVEDSSNPMDANFDLDDESGDAEITITELAGNWHDASGQLDDVSEGLLNAIDTVYRNAKIIDLPVVINISVRNTMGANIGEFQRRSKTPGNTDFRKIEGTTELFDSFMNRQAYNIPTVNDLEVDD